MHRQRHGPRQVLRLCTRNQRYPARLRPRQHPLQNRRSLHRMPQQPQNLHRLRLPHRLCPPRLQNQFRRHLRALCRPQDSRLPCVLRRERLPEFARHSRARNLLQRDRLPEPQLRLRGPPYPCGLRCRPVATGGRFQGLFPAVSAPVVHARDNQCVHSLVKAADRFLRGKEAGPAVPVDQEVEQADPGPKGPEQCLPVRVQVRARPDVRVCCRHFQRRCRPRRNPASPCIRGGRRSDNGRWLTSAKWKVSGSCIPRASAPVQVAEEERQWRRRQPSRARHAK